MKTANNISANQDRHNETRFEVSFWQTRGLFLIVWQTMHVTCIFTVGTNTIIRVQPASSDLKFSLPTKLL